MLFISTYMLSSPTSYSNIKILKHIKIYKFLFWLFVHLQKQLDRRDLVGFKISDITTWLTNNCNTLPSISRTRGYQTIQFIQLIEYNLRNIFLKKSYTKCGWEAILFKIIEIEHISGSAVWNFIQFVFIVYPSRGLLKYIETKVLTTCFYLTWSSFKNKNRSRTSLVLNRFIALVICY